MNLGKIIRYAIAFVIIVLFLGIYNLLTIFAPNKPSINNLPPAAITSKVWAVISRILLIVMVVIIVVMFNLWVAWRILKFISKFTFGFGDLVIKMFPVFKELEKAGVFALFDDVVGGLLKFDFRRVFSGLAKFFNRSGKYIVETVAAPAVSKIKVVSDSKGTPVDEEAQKPKEAKGIRLGQGAGGETTEDTTEEDSKVVLSKVDECILEKSVPVDEKAPFVERLKARAENQKVSLLCRLENVSKFKK